jgi:AcrR family transcriptional regulator
VLAEKGEGLTVSDVAAEAEVSNGTFYNYFGDREEFLVAVAEQSALALAAAAASEPVVDPARRFALATAHVLLRASEDPTWGRVVLRLLSRPGANVDLAGYLREDLAEGLARKRFDTGPDDATLDQVAGLIAMTIRRLVEGAARPDAPQQAVARALRALGVKADEAAALADEAISTGTARRPEAGSS